MKTAIVYYSKHHGNTKKLIDAIAAKHEVDLIDVTNTPDADLSGYDRIGIASGVYGGNLAKQVVAFAEKNLPEGKGVFYIYTSSVTKDSALKAVRAIAGGKGNPELGAYHSKGFDTFGPFKLVGGVGKGHPNDAEISGAVEFYEGLGE